MIHVPSKSVPPRFCTHICGSSLVLFVLFLLMAHRGAAQQQSVNDPVVYGQGNNPIGMLIVSIAGDDGKPLTDFGVVTILRDGEVSGDHQNTTSSGVVRFTQLAWAHYTIVVSVSGYRDERASADISPNSSAAEVSVTLTRVTGESTQSAADNGVTLAPKAKKEAQKGLDALHDGKYGEAQKHLEAALEMAPGNPDLNDRMGELFIVTKKYDQAQSYLQKAISLQPDNAGALTDLGWLHVQQGDSSDAQPLLQRAIAADPQRWFTHYLLALSYLREGQFDQARGEAATAVKVGKGQAIDAEYLLGECLAVLGRNEEAIKTLQEMLKDAPTSSNAPAAQTLIAKLQAAGTQALFQSTASVSPAKSPGP